ncbi:MAG: 4-oxalocrotonate tautomerase [Planctomycetes bacterium]|nr:4-oxalocrotonate tautomerase [Planctomycetota bacterium]
MPLTLTLTEGVLPASTVKDAIQRLTKSMLAWHELTNNSVMTPNVTANVHIVPRGSSFSGGEEFSGAWIEWKVPSFAFASREIQKGFGQDATDIIHELSGGKQPKDNVYFNVVHTVDGAWNLDGQAMSNEELGQAIAKG